jgi:hypothetical protein
VKVPEAGWLSLRRDGRYVFVPLPKFQSPSFPGMLPAVIGAHTPAKIAIQCLSFKGHLPTYVPARLKKLPGNRYQVGPFIAILAADGKKPFHGNQQNFADLIRMGRSMGVTVYVITPSGFEKKDTTIKGFLLDYRTPGIRWITAKLPIPNVIYNRLPNRTVEQKPEVQQTIQKILNTPGIHFFNPGFFNKWSLYQQISTSPELGQLLPDTAKMESLEILKQMLNRHPILYLKPVEGKAGIKMMRITKKPNSYELYFQTKEEKKRFSVSSLTSLWTLIQKLKMPTAYILQQGIRLVRYQGNPFDVRMLLQKDSHGQWSLTGVGIRIAGNDAISTHVPMGGRIEEINKVMQEVFEKKKREILHQAEKLGLQVATFIDSKQPSPLGEMSIDLGIEKNGRIWFFEANAKPMKFDEPEIRTLSLRRIIQYSLYLSGFSPLAKGAEQ